MIREVTKDHSSLDLLSILRRNIKHINTVGEWAKASGYSRSHFYALVKQYFRDTPYEVIKKEKLTYLRSLLQKNPVQKGYRLAVETGFDDMQSLYKFLAYNFDITLTDLREQLPPTDIDLTENQTN